MIASLSAASLVAMHSAPWGGGFPWFFLVIPLFWIAFFALLFVLLRRRGAQWRPGPWAAGAQSGPWAQRGAEHVLAERFARGDIDETEYRARLEVLRQD